jgi:hypothetical protein
MWMRKCKIPFMTRRVFVGVIASGCWIVLPADPAQARAGHTPQRQLTEQITQTIAKVGTGESSTARTEAAEHLADLTRQVHAKSVDDKTIADLTSLLNTSDDSVRYWVARCLGNLGLRARAAIPELQKLLTEVDCLQGSKTSASGIRFALSQMDITPPPLRCPSLSKPD